MDDQWDTIPLFCCTSADIDNTRHHILKFQSKTPVNPTATFNLPIRLHRKDPKNLQFQLTRAEIDQRKKENEELARKEAEAQARRDAGEELPEEQITDESDGTKFERFERLKKSQPDLSQIAPDGGARKPKGKKLFKKQTRQITLMNEGRRKLRYEEYYPWVMEDYDGKNTWVGSYEAGNSDTYVLFVLEKDQFKMIPAEKVYKFTQRNKYATLTLEEAEAKMEQKSNVPRWVMRHVEGSTPTESRSSRVKIKTVVGRGEKNTRDSDHDDLDFDEEFADDEETPIMDGDAEENKLSEQRMKKEMMKANGFEEDGDDDDDLFGDRVEDKEGKRLRKTLIKTELKVYETDEEQNPYLSSEDLESEEEEEQVVVKEEVVKEEVATPQGVKRGRPKKQVYVKYAGEGFVVIKVPSAVLSSFPGGDWNAGVEKRPFPQVNKRVKMSSNSPEGSPAMGSPGWSESPVKAESPVGIPGLGSELVTPGDVIDAVVGGATTTKELLNSLRDRIHGHQDNKRRVIEYVKRYLKLVDGKLVVKE